MKKSRGGLQATIYRVWLGWVIVGMIRVGQTYRPVFKLKPNTKLYPLSKLLPKMQKQVLFTKISFNSYWICFYLKPNTFSLYLEY